MKTAEDMLWMLHPASRFAESWIDEWDGLNDRKCGRHPLLSGALVAAMLAHYGTEADFVASCRVGDDLRGLLILRRKGRGAWQTFQPAQATLGPALLPDVMSLAGLFRALPGVGLSLDLYCQDPDYAPIVDLDSTGHCETTPYWTTNWVDITGSFDDYWRLRSNRLQENVARILRRIERHGHATRLEFVSVPDLVPDAVRRFGDLESSGWKGKAGTAVHADNEQGRFYSEALSSLATRGQARIYQLFFDDRLVASEMCVTGPRMLVTMKSTYDEQWSSFAPGRILQFELLRQIFGSREFPRVEFYTNANADMLKWGTGQRTIAHLTAYRNGFVGSLVRGRRKLLSRAHALGERASSLRLGRTRPA